MSPDPHILSTTQAPAFAAGAALFFFAPAALVLTALPGAAGWLADEEILAMMRLKREADRRRHLAAHGLKRHLCARYLNAAPSAFRFRRDRHGRPALIGGGDVDVNISHAGDWVAVALGRGGRVGVDIASAPADFDWADIDRHLFASIAPEMGRDRLEYWARLEALGKAAGGGLAALPHDILGSGVSGSASGDSVIEDFAGGSVHLDSVSRGAWACSVRLQAQAIINRF